MKEKKDIYNFSEIEKKWQKRWEEENLFECKISPDLPKYYYLDMFPYPSGQMHMGHVRNYVIGDVISRYKIMKGFNVLHPTGWDSFGLPAENAAIQRKIHPREFTKENIATMKEQIKSLGISYNWEREINTSDESFYVWTQWIFLQMYKKGLAYKKLFPINWCPSCKTGLANEEVVGGMCERCGAEVTKKDLEQWMLKITSYADRLLEDLDKLDWPEKVKIMQKNWIGKSEGAEVIFRIKKDKKYYNLPVYTTRPDTLFGATYVVLSPEHPFVLEVVSEEKKKEAIEYIEKVKKESDIERTSTSREKTGVHLGCYAINPVNNKEIPVFIADYVLIEYGTGAIMAVPAHDQRDFDFAKKFNLEIIEVISSEESKKDGNGNLTEAYVGEGILINSGKFNGLNSKVARKEITNWLATKNLAKFAINYKLRDWVFSRQRYWGEPIPVVYCKKCGEVPVPEKDLPVLLPEVKEYEPSGTGKSPLSLIPEFFKTTCPKCNCEAERETDTMPQWAGSSWYFLRFASPHYNNGPFENKEVNYWLPVDQYVGGIEHAILHLLYARFFTKFLYDLGLFNFDEPFKRLFNQGMITKNGAKMSKSKGNVVIPDEIIKKYGADTLRLFILFIGPPEDDAEWSDQAVLGAFRFLNRIWSLFNNKKITQENKNENLEKILHKTIKKVGEDIERFHFHTAISSLMELLNNFYQEDEINQEFLEKFIILLSPFVPHIAFELWEKLGNKNNLYKEKWPKYDEDKIKEEQILIIIQINGKVRDKITVPFDITEDELKKEILERPKIKKNLEDKKLIKFISVPNKLVNLVVR